ncbi:hypothetical protein [Pseudogracilibacillus sp. SO30301A]|uniref:hypothetical protein n=1 Tax=Pseudogracilibacillus sp. SO30301A TaxID=3098291 RepID=UPI00300E40AA
MSKQFQGALYYLFANIRFSLTVFWAILLALLIVTIAATILMPDTEIAFELSIPVYVFAAVIGYWTVNNAFPYLIKMGSTRKNIFISFGVYAFLLTLLNAVISNTVNKFVSMIIGTERDYGIITIMEDDTSMTFNHIGDLLGVNSWMMRIVIDTSISFFLLAVMFIIGLIFYQFGLIGGFSFLGALVMVIVFGFSNGWLLDFIILIYENFSFSFFFQLFTVGVFVYLCSFFLLRRITI